MPRLQRRLHHRHRPPRGAPHAREGEGISRRRGFTQFEPTVSDAGLRPTSRVTMTAGYAFAFSPRGLRPRFASSLPPRNQRAQGRPGARCTRGLVCNCAQKTRTRAYRSSGSIPAFPAQWLYGLLRALVSAKSARMCERAVLTNRPSLDLIPFVLKGREPVGERGTDPVSSSTRTVARASSPNRARKGVDDGTK